MECTSKAGKQNKNEPTRTAGLASLLWRVQPNEASTVEFSNAGQRGNLEPTKLRSRGLGRHPIAGTVTRVWRQSQVQVLKLVVNDAD
ncbi:hypothetical protein KQX54_011140 [Cotesia glomerata]|uniref:Uncharacterized protein n=1 Tax=Cotesia glomerata TaxID=32391 RepID=A0AAV7I0D6_COTGL|nr:hypothetical protein KQX54_011140 [Cotesia glomerata]